MYDFCVKKLDNIKFDLKELQDYYNKLVNEYPHYKWTVSKDTDTKTHKVENVYSWAIQSNLKDPTIPCPPYHIDSNLEIDERNNFDVPTELIFGFAKKVIEGFPNVRQTVITCHPPDTIIDLHTDNEEFLKIHIPIYANDKSLFRFENEDFVLEEGSAYLVNTTIPHGVNNMGSSDRVHFIFKIKMEDVDKVLNNEWILDPNQLDFDILELPNVSFNHTEVLDYWNQVNDTCKDLQWHITEKDLPDDPRAKVTLGINGYAILTNLDDINVPCNPPGNSNKDDKHKKFDRPTKLLFGIADKIYNSFPKCEELGITVHPAGSCIPPHVDKDDHVRIHIPIITNDNAWFIHGDTKLNLKPGKAYIVNTKRKHCTMNQGDTDRAHILFKIPYVLAKQITEMKINL